jgi:hypothetical protein
VTAFRQFKPDGMAQAFSIDQSGHPKFASMFTRGGGFDPTVPSDLLKRDGAANLKQTENLETSAISQPLKDSFQ